MGDNWLLMEMFWEDFGSPITTTPPPWFAREVAYKSPNGLITHPDVEILCFIEIGRKEDLEWARHQIRTKAGYPAD